ncbi:hypothetical protein [Metabacillus sp. Hm71]|uniref:hypothetical protein n=1 Tax=Metabacillus sp. Hm71 TaxID=3450743 RepID=UPI003F424622
MGYILPIQHDAYIQYANRSVPMQQHYSHTYPIAAVPSAKKELKQQRLAAPYDQKIKIPKTNKDFDSFSGKGQFINEYV